EAVEFCRRLSERPEEQEAGRRYRLPTEAEWEYACRAGTISTFNTGARLTSQEANFDGTNPYHDTPAGTHLGHTTAVGSYPPNGFGLCDMHGNVWEWCNDWFSESYYADEWRTNPAGPESGTLKVVRGGSWVSSGKFCRTAQRDRVTPESAPH